MLQFDPCFAYFYAIITCQLAKFIVPD